MLSSLSAKDLTSARPAELIRTRHDPPESASVIRSLSRPRLIDHTATWSLTDSKSASACSSYAAASCTGAGLSHTSAVREAVWVWPALVMSRRPGWVLRKVPKLNSSGNSGSRQASSVPAARTRGDPRKHQHAAHGHPVARDGAPQDVDDWPSPAIIWRRRRPGRPGPCRRPHGRAVEATRRARTVVAALSDVSRPCRGPAQRTRRGPSGWRRREAGRCAALDSGTSITVNNASSDSRQVLIESNWQLCEQKPGDVAISVPILVEAGGRPPHDPRRRRAVLPFFCSGISQMGGTPGRAPFRML